MRAVAALLAAALSLAASPAAPRSGRAAALEDHAEQAAGVETKFWLLITPRARSVKRDEAATAKQIASLGPEVIRPVIALYLGELAEPEPDYEVDAHLIDARPRILLAALRLLPRAAVFEEIEAAARRSDDVDRRLALARVLSELGGEKALRRILAIAAELDPIQWARTFAQVQLQGDIACILRGDRRLARGVAYRTRDCDPAFAAILVRALAEAGSWQVAGEMAHALGRDSNLDLCLTESLAALAERADGTFPESVLSALRRRLDSADGRVVRAAATALGHLGDEAAASRLAQLLDERDPQLRAAARSALVALGGPNLPAERQAWENWLEHERAWSLERLPELESTCAQADPALLSAAVSELAVHRLYRHRAALALLPTLVNQNPVVVCLACRSLPVFGSRAVVSALRPLAHDGDPDIRAAAAWALRALTGEVADPTTPPVASRP